MPDKPSRLRVKSDGLAPPAIDAQPVENEILLSLPAKEREVLFPQLTFVAICEPTMCCTNRASRSNLAIF